MSIEDVITSMKNVLSDQQETKVAISGRVSHPSNLVATERNSVPMVHMKHLSDDEGNQPLIARPTEVRLSAIPCIAMHIPEHVLPAVREILLCALYNVLLRPPH